MLEGLKARARGLGRAVRSVGKRNRTLIRLYSTLIGQRERAYFELGRWRKGEGIDPARMVWIFGSGRSGSTWLRSMMGELDGTRVWEEPMVGRLFGEFYSRAPKDNLRSADFVMGDPIRRGWIRSVRNFVLDGALYSNPRLGSGEYLIVKEPNGSVGAPLLMEALPESRMILLVRDEDLGADTMNEMRRIYAVLGIAVEDEDLRLAVEKHSWENVPDREKGRGKFYRRGTSGGWKEDLTPKQVEVVEKTTASLLERFYPEP